jgi:hypothetical protein
VNPPVWLISSLFLSKNELTELAPQTVIKHEVPDVPPISHLAHSEEGTLLDASG